MWNNQASRKVDSQTCEDTIRVTNTAMNADIKDCLNCIWHTFILQSKTVISFFLCAVCTEYVALYSYSSSEPGDLTFTEGEEILVTQKEGEWWTGSIDGRTGIFPSNYVRPKDQEVSSDSGN